MKKISIALLILIAISCRFAQKNGVSGSKPEKKSAIETVEPRQFINRLPEKLAENSGIIFYDSLLWTINDSGGKNRIYAFSFSGKIEKEIELKNSKNRDWEDIAQDKKYIYVGDFGNNRGTRKDQTIYRIEKKEIGKKGKQELKAEKIKFSFADQTDFSTRPQANPYDCEAVVSYKKSLYVFTKNWSNRTTSVYKIPKKKGDYTVEPLAEFNVNGLITGADISPDKTKLVLIGYKDYKPILWIFSNIDKENIWGTRQEHFEMDSIFDAQTEGVCFLGNDSILISCERTRTFQQQVFLLDLNNLE